MKNEQPSNNQQVLAALQRIWGYKQFRPPQEEIIHSLLATEDALIVMPTGGGKSLCFQLPALLQTGLTLVVSPLIALMENQVQELRQRHLPGAILHSELPTHQKKQTLQALEAQQLRLLYLSPETLLSPPVWAKLAAPGLKINSLVLDEAHCLVQWGDTFRPAYRRLGAVRPALLQHKPPGSKIAIAAFTATADPHSQQTLKQVLQLQQPKTFLLSPYRANLNLRIQIVWTPRGRRKQMLNFLHSRAGQTGLIYVRSRRDSEELAQWCQKLGYRTAAYHGGLNARKRREVEAHWLVGKIQFAVCTCAFGMGVNKPDVRWIVHFHSPHLLWEYIQEVGRSGRDDKPADALTLLSEPTGWLNTEDRQREQFFVQQWQKKYHQARSLARRLPSQGEVKQVTQQFRDGEIALALLHSAGQLQWQDPFSYQQRSGNSAPSFARLQKLQRHNQGQMQRYLKTRACRWRFLLRAFGFTQEAEGFHCGHCDNCQ